MKLFELHEQNFDLEKFKSDCAPFLAELKGASSVLYHGSHHSPTDFEVRQFKERSGPRDTLPRIHTELNDIFKQKYGHEIRNWLFTTGDRHQARVYGPLNVIFPIGSNYNYVWSPFVEDMTSHRTGFVDKYHHLPYDERQEKANDEFLNDIATTTFHVDKQLHEALESRHEIHLKCEKFYIFKWTGDTYEDQIRTFLATEILTDGFVGRD